MKLTFAILAASLATAIAVPAVFPDQASNPQLDGLGTRDTSPAYCICGQKRLPPRDGEATSLDDKASYPRNVKEQLPECCFKHKKLPSRAEQVEVPETLLPRQEIRDCRCITLSGHKFKQCRVRNESEDRFHFEDLGPC